MVELTELASRSFIVAARKSGDQAAFVQSASKTHGVNVNLSEVDSLSTHLCRSYIVSVYHSAERFLHDFREEHVALYRNAWVGDGMSVDPLTVALRNIAASQSDAEDRIGKDLITRFQYYRIVRNWIVHTKDSDQTKLDAKHAEIAPYSEEHERMFSTLEAPNLASVLKFDDFVCFTRLTKRIAEKMAEIARPTPQQLVDSLSFTDVSRFNGLKAGRKRNALSGRIKTIYGLDDATANWIADTFIDSLA